jgi:hypothetical protein
MASPPRSTEREEERRHNARTLVIASAASASAALIVSQLWIAGTWIAAALTPALVALLSELLSRPTERITRGLTSDRPALSESRFERGEQPEADREAPEPPVRIYRAGSTGPTSTRRRKIAYGAVFGTAALAFAIAVVVLTVPELVTGQSVGKNNGRTTFFGGGGGKKSTKQQSPQDTTTDGQKTETQPTTPTEKTTPTGPTNTTPSDTTPTTPPATTAPAPTTPTAP